MLTAKADIAERFDPVRIFNADSIGPLIILCDHASNFLPREFGTLGLSRSDLKRHIAWDPGAARVARLMARRLDAALIESGVSRLVADCNRAIEAADLIPVLSESTVIPGNKGLSDDERAGRIALAHAPFHEAVEKILISHLVQGRAPALVSVHSYSPIFLGVTRPWHIGIIHDDDERLAAPLLAALSRIPGVTAAANQPYSPADGVYYSLERHARNRDLPCAMIEIRNDEILTAESQRLWADRLSGLLETMDDFAFGGRADRFRGEKHLA
jgi:predicted N-formylglutamate amidohydrolase